MTATLSPSLLALILAALPLTTGIAAGDSFIGTSDGNMNWFNPNNWRPTQLPTSTDYADIAADDQMAEHPTVIDNTADPTYKDMIAKAGTLTIGDRVNGYLTIKSNLVTSSFRLGASLDASNTASGHGTVTQISGTVDPGGSPEIGTTTALTGTYYLQGGSFAVGGTNLAIGGTTSADSNPGVGSFVISGGQFSVGNRIYFGNAGTASFTVIGSKATLIQVADIFNADSHGLVNLNVQIDKDGLTPIATGNLGLQGITLFPSFADGVAPYAGTWTVATYKGLAGNNTTVVLGKGVDPAHWSTHLNTSPMQLTVTYQP